MDTKFKVGDKIRITKTSFEAKKRYKIGDIKTIVSIVADNFFVVDSNYLNDHTAYITSHDPHFNVEWELVEEKSRFHDAQPGDLLWNDELGINKIGSIDCCQNYPISVISDSSSDVITLDGKRYLESPKATFFYYSPENHYLTERPEFEVDWAKVPMNTQVFVSDGEIINPQNEVSFFGYFSELERPFWIFRGMTEEYAEGFKFCRLAEPCKPEWRK